MILRTLLAGQEGLAPHLLHCLEGSITTWSEPVKMHCAPAQALTKQRATHLLARAVLAALALTKQRVTHLLARAVLTRSRHLVQPRPAVRRRVSEALVALVLLVLLVLLLHRIPFLVRRRILIAAGLLTQPYP